MLLPKKNVEVHETCTTTTRFEFSADYLIEKLGLPKGTRLYSEADYSRSEFKVLFAKHVDYREHTTGAVSEHN